MTTPDIIPATMPDSRPVKPSFTAAFYPNLRSSFTVNANQLWQAVKAWQEMHLKEEGFELDWITAKDYLLALVEADLTEHLKATLSSLGETPLELISDLVTPYASDACRGYLEGIRSALTLSYPSDIAPFQVLDAAIRASSSYCIAEIFEAFLLCYPDFEPRKKHQKDSLVDWGLMERFDEFKGRSSNE